MKRLKFDTLVHLKSSLKVKVVGQRVRAKMHDVVADYCQQSHHS